MYLVPVTSMKHPDSRRHMFGSWSAHNYPVVEAWVPNLLIAQKTLHALGTTNKMWNA